MNLKIWDVIKYEGNNSFLVWKHEAEDFNTNSILIVREPMEAIFFSNGQIADIFPAGKYTLSTGNIPVLRKLLQIPTGGVSPFHCQVYFVNKVETMNLLWGTNGKVQFIEPNYNFPMEIGARGVLSLRVRDSAIFVARLVGVESSITPETLTRYFRGFIQNRVKSQLARTIKEQQLNIFEIDTQLDILSDVLRSRLKKDFESYGVELVQFIIEEVVRPEDDLNYIKLKNIAAQRYTDVFAAQTKSQVDLIHAQTEAQAKVIGAQAMAEKRRLEGYTYQDERSFDVAQTVAQNESANQFTGLGIGLGMMSGVGGAMGGAMAGIVGGAMGGLYGGGQPPVPPAPAASAAVYAAGAPQTPPPAAPQEPEGKQPPKTRTCVCGAEIPFGAKFCPECGAPQPRLCPKCGAEVKQNAKFCSECGEKLS